MQIGNGEVTWGMELGEFHNTGGEYHACELNGRYYYVWQLIY